MGLACRIVVRGIVVLYTLALILFLTGALGWFGQEQDALSGVFLVPLGLPWNRLLAGAPQSLLPWIGAAAPLVNILLLDTLCRRLNA